MREIKRVTYSSINSVGVIDGNCQITIIRKPRKRYRAIIRSFYRKRIKKKNNMS